MRDDGVNVDKWTLEELQNVSQIDTRLLKNSNPRQTELLKLTKSLRMSSEITNFQSHT